MKRGNGEGGGVWHLNRDSNETDKSSVWTGEQIKKHVYPPKELVNGDCQHVAMETLTVGAAPSHTLSNTFLVVGSSPKTLIS